MKPYTEQSFLYVNPATTPLLPQEKKLVGEKGFEPLTPRSQSEYSARLSYTPIILKSKNFTSK